MQNFIDLGLNQRLLDAVKQEGYENPTPIQAQAIPPLMLGKDLLGIAQTGTGKTAAFALPILHRLGLSTERVAKGHVRTLVLTPTRELAMQIHESFKTYGKYTKLTKAVVFGGVSINRQVEICRGGLDIIVATPGRLIDLIERKAISLSKVEIFVLDEVDQMLDLGFIHAIKRIVTMVPKQRQNLFFSATMPKEIAGLASNLLTDPVRVEIAPVATTAERVNQEVMFVEQKDKLAVLNELLKDNNFTRTLIFTKTKHGADKVVRGLEKGNYGASAIHGNKSQNNRQAALNSFKAGKIQALVATDIAARGIDIEAVSHVINFDLPHVPESYVHRIGRTARAGNGGEAIAFCSREERGLLRDIERTIRQKITVREMNFVLPPPDLSKDKPVSAERQSRGDRPERAPRGERPARRDSAPVQAQEEAPRHVDDESMAVARKRSDWTPMDGAPTIMYQKPQERPAREPRAHQPWMKKEGFRTEGSTTRSEKPRGDRPYRGDRPAFNADRPRRDFGDKPAFNADRPRRDFGDKPAFSADRPKRNYGDKPSFNSDRPRANYGDKPAFNADRPRTNYGDKPAFNADRPKRDYGDKPVFNADRPRGNYGDKPAFNADRPRGNFGDKPKTGFGGKPRSFGGGKPGGFGASKPGGFNKPSGGTFKRRERTEG